jgi:hypothetical protein
MINSDNLRLIGTALIIIGSVALLLPFGNIDFIFLKWINRWGRDMGWMIRVGILVLGALVYTWSQYKE